MAERGAGGHSEETTMTGSSPPQAAPLQRHQGVTPGLSQWSLEQELHRFRLRDLLGPEKFLLLVRYCLALLENQPPVEAATPSGRTGPGN